LPKTKHYWYRIVVHVLYRKCDTYKEFMLHDLENWKYIKACVEAWITRLKEKNDQKERKDGKGEGKKEKGKVEKGERRGRGRTSSFS